MLKGRTALVTGSTSGIGIAETLAGRGANVILNGFGDRAEIERLRARIADARRVTVKYDGRHVEGRRDRGDDEGGDRRVARTASPERPSRRARLRPPPEQNAARVQNPATRRLY